MGLVDNVERGLEKLVTSVFRGSGGGGVQPVEIASKIRNEMDHGTLTVSQTRTIAPNDFQVSLSGPDFERIKKFGSALPEELCDVVVQHARGQHYALTGDVSVAFREDEELRDGEIQVAASIAREGESSAQSPAPAPSPAAPGPSAPAPSPAGGTQRTQPILQFGGKRYGLNSDSIILGRSSQADIPVDDTGVSRRHLEIRQENGRTYAVDLGSTNGSYVNGQRIDGRAELFDGSIITMGRSRITFRLLPQSSGERS
ncbi:DUF3662 and FHA domain-containing protein [Zhihengliuella sp.]|uniref:DUF3662 and FHA domain-containing protein n=1 Tax=Zhihengliuella sp. TaxID=1954483 RepID=UPI0028117080|nr:DUF3662 and FHA domain-containing protein [Zhihengliuella sp.]